MDNRRKFARRVRSEIADRLQTDFVKQRPLYINLLDDLGSVDSFIIDGDALLLECVANPHNDLRHGGQPLHLIYLIENFIYSLKHCLNARFSFVFFDNHASIWEGNAFFEIGSAHAAASPEVSCTPKHPRFPQLAQRGVAQVCVRGDVQLLLAFQQ